MEEPDPAAASARRSLSLVIPAYNEAAGIGEAILQADQALAGLAPDYEILVIDDGSTDGTAQVAADAARQRARVRLLRHAENRGYGAALRTGFEAARFELVAFTDADCQFDLTDLASLVALTDRCPLVAGYRLERQDPWQRRFFSWGYNLLVRTLLGTGVRDCDCALKVFRKEALGSLLPETNGFFVNAEMLAHARQLGCGIAEVGVQHRPRLRGHSKVSWTDIPRTLGTLLPFWWSRVLFPFRAPLTDVRGSESPAALGSQVEVDRRFAPRLSLLMVAVVAALLFFSRLHCPLLEPDEARYAEIPRQMLAEKRFAVPVLDGLPYYHKPPLLYWLVMASYAAFGVEDWAAHLVPCLAAFLTVLVTYRWGLASVGHWTALAGALMLTLSARFVYLGRMLTMDSLLCLWVVAALASAHLAIRGRSLRWSLWLLSAGACGLGLLTKGPVALLLVAIPVLVLQGLDRRVARPRLWPWLAYLAVLLGVACPWYAAVWLSDPAFGREFFWVHNLVRYLAPLDHQKPFWFYLPEVLLGMLPWTLLLQPLSRFLLRGSGKEAARRPPELGFFLLVSLWCLLFYSAAGCKRPGYVLPAMPPLALALGCYADLALLRARRPIGAWVLSCAVTFALLLAAVQQMLPGHARKYSLRKQVRPFSGLDAQVPVVCYPHRWDSVSFYLCRHVQAYSADQRRELITALTAAPRALLFVKADGASGELLSHLVRELPHCLEVTPCGPPGAISAALVHRRQERLATEMARSEDVAGSEAHSGPGWR